MDTLNFAEFDTVPLTAPYDLENLYWLADEFDFTTLDDQSCDHLLQPRKSDDDESLGVLKYGFRLCCTTVLHPLDYAKTLIQLGHEPIAPRPGKTLFGVKRLMLPNIFQYAYHIGSVDGFMGCFRGLSPKLLGNILSSYYSEKLANKVGFPVYENSRNGKNYYTEDNPVAEEFVATMKRNVVVSVTGVVISHPFHVISVRMMAQFIGREQLYRGLWQSVKVIWNTEGIRGFFSGIVPRLLVDLGCVTITGTITYLVSKYVVKNRTVVGNVNAVTQFVVSSWLYPYHVVSTCMVVNGTRLKAGNPPLMNQYYNWYDCYRRLRMANEHKRGASFFFRTMPRTPVNLRKSPSVVPFSELKKTLEK